MHNHANTDQGPSLMNFMFEDHEVRMTPGISNAWIWAAGQDVFAAAGLAWNGRNSIKLLPKRWVKVLKVHTVKGEKEAIFIAEPGIYQVLSRSTKPKPQAMFRWIFEEVLPLLRKQGFFGVVSGSERIRLSKELRACLAALPKSDAFGRDLLIQEIRAICAMLGYPVPSLDLIGADPAQLALPMPGGE